MKSKRCQLDTCNRNVHCRSYCRPHYRRLMESGDVREDIPIRETNNGAICKVTNCDRKATTKKMCDQHYRRAKKFGHPQEDVPIRNRNKPGVGTITYGYRQITKNGITKLEHRWVMEDYLGRELYPHETVHHINGDRLDNRIENLELWSGAQPPGQRVEDKIKWAITFLGEYGYVVG